MNSLEKKITPGFLLRFTLPTVVMMVFNSFYTMVDGGFVSRFVGTGALSAVNIVYPALNLVFALGIMLATGGSAVVAKLLGEGREEHARRSFTTLVVVALALGAAMTAAGTLLAGPGVRMLGANDAVFAYCRDYMFTLSLFVPFAMLQLLFQYFFVAAARPNLGLISTVAGGVANIVLDYLFIGPLQMGIAGAALATGIGYCVPALFGLAYFFLRRNGSLYFVRPKFSARFLLYSCANGSSEMVTNLSTAVTTLLFNQLMMRYLGEDGVAAITIVLYVQFLLTAVYLGYSGGIAPVFSYKYGNRDIPQIRSAFRTSIRFIGICSIASLGIALALAAPIAYIFTPPGNPVFELAVHGFHLFAISFLFSGINIFSSALFTAFSNGKISALLSFLRTFGFILLALLLLPLAIGVDGVWLSIPAAEALALLVSAWYMVRLKPVYGY